MGGNQVSATEKSKRVLDIVSYLSRERVPKTLAEIRAQFPGEFNENELADHNYVATLHGDTSNPIYTYIPIIVKKYSVKVENSNDILQLCSNEPSGVLGSDLRDAYPNAGLDLDALISDQKVVRIFREGRKEQHDDYEVIYSMDNVYSGVVVDEDIRELWKNIEIPKTIAELEAKLRANKQETVSVQDDSGPVVQQKKKKLANKSSKISVRFTNTHKSDQLRKFINAQNEDD